MNTMTQKKEVRVQIRTEEDLKKQTDEILNRLGLSFSGCINVFLKRFVAENGFPFSVTLTKDEIMGADIMDLERRMAEVVLAETKPQEGKPIARYDSERKIPYMEYPGERRDYDIA